MFELSVAGLATVAGGILGVLLGALYFLAWLVDWGMDHFDDEDE